MEEEGALWAFRLGACMGHSVALGVMMAVGSWGWEEVRKDPVQRADVFETKKTRDFTFEVAVRNPALCTCQSQIKGNWADTPESQL